MTEHAITKMQVSSPSDVQRDMRNELAKQLREETLRADRAEAALRRRRTPIPKGVKWRDHLLSAAMRLASHPNRGLAFLKVADQVIEDVQASTERKVQAK